MPYPPDLQRRFSEFQGAVRRRLAKLETRTSWFDTGSPLSALPGVIDPGYSGSGDPAAYVNGSPDLTGPYQTLASYAPAASDPVLLLPVVTASAGATYVVLGRLS